MCQCYKCCLSEAVSYKNMIESSTGLIKDNPQNWIPGLGISAAEGSWQLEVQKACYGQLTMWAKGLGQGDLTKGQAEEGAKLMYMGMVGGGYYHQDAWATMTQENTQKGPNASFIYSTEGRNGGMCCIGCCKNCCCFAGPVCLTCIARQVAVPQMAKIEYREVHYEMGAWWLLPKYDFKKKEFTPDPTDIANGTTRPDDLENRYVWVWGMCQGKCTVMSQKSVNPVGSERLHTFYEMQLVKLKRDSETGTLVGELTSLIELDGYDQATDAKGNPVSPYIATALSELRRYLSEQGIVHTDAMGPWRTQAKLDTQKPDDKMFEQAKLKFYSDCKLMKGSPYDKLFNHLSHVDAKYDELMAKGVTPIATPIQQIMG